MAETTLVTRGRGKGLRRIQRRRSTLLARVEQAALRLERRKRKLRALDASIAELGPPPANTFRRRLPGTGANGIRHARLIFNPSAGGDEPNSALRLAQVVVGLRAHGIRAHIELNTSSRAARTLARDAVREADPLLVVAAGDGTVEEVAAELAGTPTVLGIVPIGTMNNLARSLGVPLDLDGACALIGRGAPRQVDVGRVTSEDGARLEFFLETAGVGLSAIAALAGRAGEKRHGRFIARLLSRFIESRPDTIQVELDGQVVEASSRIVTVSNSPLMGSNLRIAPAARMDDGLLDVALYDGMSDDALLEHFKAAAGDHPHPIQSYRARHVKISAEEALPSRFQPHAGSRRHVVEIEVVPRALAVITGEGMGLSHSAEDAPAMAIAAPELPMNGNSEAKPGRPIESEV